MDSISFYRFKSITIFRSLCFIGKNNIKLYGYSYSCALSLFCKRVKAISGYNLQQLSK
jgi:hypothetical protein